MVLLTEHRTHTTYHSTASITEDGTLYCFGGELYGCAGFESALVGIPPPSLPIELLAANPMVMCVKSGVCNGMLDGEQYNNMEEKWNENRLKLE